MNAKFKRDYIIVYFYPIGDFEFYSRAMSVKIIAKAKIIFFFFFIAFDSN